ncbi:hypothetical protein [Streptomyces sp. NPDC006879]|uniref:hypothetical protein n=1 Tax=Streptomyces sp. NPDC006879 TaxID=3364767 RepID=UPI00369FAAF3
MSTPFARTGRRGARAVRRTGLDRAEAALVEQYAALVRLAYLVLPTAAGRHRRVLLAHALVQQAMPVLRAPGREAPVPAQAAPGRGAHRAPEPSWPWERVLRAALAYDRRPGWWPRFLDPPRALLPRLPIVHGLRLFPQVGEPAEVALAQSLSTADAPTRAAWLMRYVEGFDETAVRQLLARAGISEPDAVVLAAQRLHAGLGSLASSWNSPSFDPCSLQTRPTDLFRRRRRQRAAGALLLGLAVLSSTTLQWGVTPTEQGRALPVTSIRPVELVRAGAEAWADTARVDFTAWPPRGNLIGDEALLARALTAWAKTGSAQSANTSVVLTPSTTAGGAPPAGTQLLYAGRIGGMGVVVFHDGRRIVRYTEPPATGSSGPGPEVALARADDADVTTAAAIVLTRTNQGPRYLLAPWIDQARTRDLLAPGSPERPLGLSRDGVTAPVPAPGRSAPAGCTTWPVLYLRSSGRIVEKHSFLLADLGGLSPAHLTHTPLPAATSPARQPREATGPEGLAAWSRAACGLARLRDQGVRAVNIWDFAEQRLPEGGDRAVWSCTRASSWRGPGDVRVELRTPALPGSPVLVAGSARSTAACGRFGQHVFASVRWTSASGARYLLAAGSRRVTSIAVSGASAGSGGRTRGRTLTLPLSGERSATPLLSATLADGSHSPKCAVGLCRFP